MHYGTSAAPTPWPPVSVGSSPGTGGNSQIEVIVIYPTNVLANSQAGQLRRFLSTGYADWRGPVTVRRYTGQESDEGRRAVIAKPPDILLTNYVMPS